MYVCVYAQASVPVLWRGVGESDRELQIRLKRSLVSSTASQGDYNACFIFFYPFFFLFSMGL